MKSCILLAALMTVACSITVKGADAAAEGKALYTAKCQGCHGASGEGKAAVAKMLKATIPELGSQEVQAKSDADLKKVITAGKGKMKPVAALNEAQVTDVVAFVRTLKK